MGTTLPCVPNAAVGPLVLLEGQTYGHILGSMQELLDYVEAIDVWNGEFTVFDAEGQEVVLAAESDVGPVTATIGSKRKPEELRAILADYLRPVAVKFGLVDTDLELASLLRVLWRGQYPRRPYPG